MGRAGPHRNETVRVVSREGGAYASGPGLRGVHRSWPAAAGGKYEAGSNLRDRVKKEAEIPPESTTEVQSGGFN